MESLTINQFFLVETKENKTANEINKIFGIPRGVTKEKWPKRNQQYMHHIITMDVRDIDLPSTIEADIISLFFYPLKMSENKPINPFQAVYLSFNDSYLKDTTNFPKDYKPWWNNDIENTGIFTKGVQFSKKELQSISKQQVQKMNEESETIELPSPLDELRGENSFIGGFPMWLQEATPPKDEDGLDTFYLMMLNGFSDYTKSTPFEGVDLYIFLDNKGKVYTVAQR